MIDGNAGQPQQQEYRPLSFRNDVFTHIRQLGSANLDEKTKIEGWKYFFSDLFACQCDPNIQPLTFANLSANERKIITDNLLTLLDNFEHSSNINFEYFQRESLSGLVLFRVDVLPMFKEVYDYEHEVSLTSTLNRILQWEIICKALIVKDNAQDLIKVINCGYQFALTEEVRATFHWWKDDYTWDSDSLHLARFEYRLDD